MSNNTLFSATLSRYLQACEDRDYDTIVSCFAETGLVRDPANLGIEGRAAIRKYFTEIYIDLAALKFRCSAIYWCNDSASVRWEGKATRQNGQELSYEGIDVFTFSADGRIAMMWAFWTPDDLA